MVIWVQEPEAMLSDPKRPTCASKQDGLAFATIWQLLIAYFWFPDYLLADSKFVYLYLKMIQYLKILTSLFVHNCTNSNHLFYFYLIGKKNGQPPLSLKQKNM